MSAEPPDDLRDAVAEWADALVETVGREYQFQHCWVFLYDFNASTLCLAAHRSSPGAGPVETPDRWTPADPGSISNRVFQTSLAALVPDISVHGMPERGVATRSELAVPIVSSGRPVGVIAVASSRPGAYGIADLEQLRFHAAAAARTYEAGAFDRVRLVEPAGDAGK